MASDQVITTLQLVQKDLDLPSSPVNDLASLQMNELHRYLTEAISQLLDKDFNKLLNALYRIDVPEHKVSRIIHLESPKKVASELASLVIERELQKIETRQKYSGS